MRLTSNLTDEMLLTELGERLRRHRLGRNLTQAQVGEQAGVSRQTVARLEAGGESRLPAVIRVLRALELLEGLEAAIPAPPRSPLQAVERQGRQRERARPSPGAATSGELWTWGDE